MNRKTTVVVLIVALLMAGMATAAAGIPVARAASQYLNVAVTSNYPGDAPQYTLTFALATMIHEGDTLGVTFGTGVGRAETGALPKSDVLLDEAPLTSAGEWFGGTLTLTTPTDLTAGMEHTLVILADAEIQNPWTSGHYRVTLEHLASKTTLISNYYSVTTVTQLIPLSLEKVVEYGQLTGVRVRIKTGLNGALIGHDLIRGPGGLMVYPDTEDTITVRLSAGLSVLWTTGGIVRLHPVYTESPFAMTVRSSTVYDTNEAGIDLRQLVLNLPHNIPANTEISIYIVFEKSQNASALSDAEYVRVFTSKEVTLVRVPPQTTGSGSGAQPGTPTDVTAPVVTWTTQQSTFSSRLLTLNISVTEDNLKQAYFITDDVNSLHTGLAVGDNALMIINRTGIKGMIVAVDKAGNTTTVPVDIPAPVTPCYAAQVEGQWTTASRSSPGSEPSASSAGAANGPAQSAAGPDAALFARTRRRPLRYCTEDARPLARHHATSGKLGR